MIKGGGGGEMGGGWSIISSIFTSLPDLARAFSWLVIQRLDYVFSIFSH